MMFELQLNKHDHQILAFGIHLTMPLFSHFGSLHFVYQILNISIATLLIIGILIGLV